MAQLPIRGEDGDRAVSPVIGVILMVAITVILAAVIASFVLGLGDQTDDVAPNVNFNGQFNDNVSEFTLSVETTDGEGDISDFELVGGNGTVVNESLGNLELSAASSETFTNSSIDPGNIVDYEEFQLIFRGDNEQVYETFEVPDSN